MQQESLFPKFVSAFEKLSLHAKLMALVRSTDESTDQAEMNRRLAVLIGDGLEIDARSAVDGEAGSTALCLLARTGRHHWVQAFALNGANLSASRKDGMTPAMIAVQDGDTYPEETVRFVGELARFGVDVNSDSEVSTAGQTLLHMACGKGREEMVSCLLQLGADPNRKVPAGGNCAHQSYANPRILQMLMRAGCLMNEPDLAGRTPVWLAARNVALDGFSFLAGAGVDLSLKTKTTSTALAIAKSNPGLESLYLAHRASAEASKVLAEMDAIMNELDLA